MGETRESRKITVGCGWTGAFVSVAIVAVRAFQPNSIPMEQWSASSWILMTLPITFPLFLAVAWLVVAFLAEIASSTFRRR